MKRYDLVSKWRGFDSWSEMEPDEDGDWMLFADHERLMREFAGWLSGDIPELRGVEIPLLAESLERFRAARASERQEGG